VELILQALNKVVVGAMSSLIIYWNIGFGRNGKTELWKKLANCISAMKHYSNAPLIQRKKK